MKKILIIGASGQVGTELVQELVKKHGPSAVIPSDIRPNDGRHGAFYQQLDALDEKAVRNLLIKEKITDVYLMAAMLSATAEQYPMKGWELNMNSLFIILEAAKDGLIKKIFWPSSIAVFGPTSQKNNSPQKGIIEPTTVYGISKTSGEHWCSYYHSKYGVDVRSVRYPGLIGSKSKPGGGTTDYAVHIFYAALEKQAYTCFLSPQRKLPMMHMEDAVRATLEIMEAPSEDLNIRTSYNIAGISFTPEELARSIQKIIPEFQMSYALDYRDDIAKSWPESIDDTVAHKSWGWKPNYTLESLVDQMLTDLKIKVLS